jgi:hypothetical protein
MKLPLSYDIFHPTFIHTFHKLYLLCPPRRLSTPTFSTHIPKPVPFSKCCSPPIILWYAMPPSLLCYLSNKNLARNHSPLRSVQSPNRCRRILPDLQTMRRGPSPPERTPTAWEVTRTVATLSKMHFVHKDADQETRNARQAVRFSGSSSAPSIAM